MRRETKKKEEGVANYGLDIMEEVEDNYESGWFIWSTRYTRKHQTNNTKTTIPLINVLEAGKKEIYVDPQYFSQEPAEYDDDKYLIMRWRKNTISINRPSYGKLKTWLETWKEFWRRL